MIEPQTFIAQMTGYKATDDDMRCQGLQFELGKWYEYAGELQLCVSGFHFCKYPSGPWSYYDKGRLFKVEAEQVLSLPETPGADLKFVCRRIRLVSEVAITGDGNTGDWNTGDGNTGDWNTGDGNTGDGNTGDGNATRYTSGFFCAKEPRVICFDKLTRYTRDQFAAKFPEYGTLCDLLHSQSEIDFAQFKRLPGITRQKLKALHAAHLAGKKGIKI